MRHLHGWAAYATIVSLTAWMMFCFAQVFWDDIQDWWR